MIKHPGANRTKVKTWYILVICAVLLASASAVQPASGAYDYEGTVVTIGDSNTRPNNMRPDQMWPGILSGVLGTQVINKGIPAQPTGDMLASFEEDVIDNNAAMVIIMGGTNDISRGINAKDVNTTIIESNLRAMYDEALDNGMTVIACTILPNDVFMPWQQVMVREVNDWIRAQASDRIIIADVNAAVRNPASPDNFNPAYKIEDGVHLNTTGHEAIANLVYGVAPAHLAANDIQKTPDGVPGSDDVTSVLMPNGNFLPLLFGGIGVALIGFLAVEVVRSNKRKRQ